MQLPDRPPPYAAAVFDCDSTLSSLEGVDELARALAPGARREIEELTARAMAGELAIEEVYTARLAAVRPSRAAVLALGRRYVETLLPHARELCSALAHLGKAVHVASGGLAPAVRLLGASLGLAPERVHAVDVRFDPAGQFAGFDAASPLVRQEGKRELLIALGLDRAPTVFVGDGSTDLAAAPVCARFVAFGGVARRPAVFAAARAHCASADLAALAPLLLSAEELAQLARHPAFAALARAAEPTH